MKNGVLIWMSRFHLKLYTANGVASALAWTVLFGVGSGPLLLWGYNYVSYVSTKGDNVKPAPNQSLAGSAVPESGLPELAYLPPRNHQTLFDSKTIRGLHHKPWVTPPDDWKELDPVFVWTGVESLNFDNKPPFTVKSIWIFEWRDEYGNRDNAFGVSLWETDVPDAYKIEVYNMDGTNGDKHKLILGSEEIFPLFEGTTVASRERVSTFPGYRFFRRTLK
jgi:hypothetical protein